MENAEHVPAAHHARFCLACSEVCDWSLLLFYLCGIATLVPEIGSLLHEGLQASHSSGDRPLMCMFSCDEPVVRLPAETCKSIVLLVMSKALRWLLQYISNNMASANEGGPPGNCTSAWFFCSFDGREIVCNGGVSTALFLHALASHPEHVLLLPDTVPAER